MILTRPYGRRLIRQGKAHYAGTVISAEPPFGFPERFCILERLDLQRIDHFAALVGDPNVEPEILVGIRRINEAITKEGQL